MPDTFPPWGNVYRWFSQLRDDGTWETINHHLVMRDRERVGREASPTAAVMDSQSVKTTESGGIRGYDGGKKIKGRKRHALVDTDGRGLKLQAHAADIQDRDGAGPLLRASRPSWPFVQLAYADAGYQGPRVAAASPIRVEIVRKPEGQVGFTVHARRWVVERFFAWINRNRRLAKGRGSHHQVGRGLPLRRFSYPTATTPGTLMNRFETDSDHFFAHLRRCECCAFTINW